LANIAAAQMLPKRTLTFQEFACVSSIVSFWALGNPRMLEANPSKSIKKSMLLISKTSKEESVTETSFLTILPVTFSHNFIGNQF